MNNNEWISKEPDKQLVARYGIPFEVTGTFVNGEKRTVVYGKLDIALRNNLT
jgi:hypothetical protein